MSFLSEILDSVGDIFVSFAKAVLMVLKKTVMLTTGNSKKQENEASS